LVLAIGGGVVAGLIGFGNATTTSERVDPAAGLTGRQLVGQRLVVGFQGTDPPARLRKRIRRGRLAGVILFADNLPSRRAGRRLIRDLQSIPRPPGLRQPLLVMTDQEGGLVKRLSGPPCCSAREMAEHGADFARAQGAGTARNLLQVGVNVDLAPVLDVGRPGSAIREERRSFGGTRKRVSRVGNAFADGLRREGVPATAKHFPGLGAAEENTDFAVQRIGLSRGTLRRTDEFPYRAFIGAGARTRLVMLSTAIYPAFSSRPAALARRLATGELRRRLGFEGVSISDALGTVAARAYGSTRELARKGARAGTDLLLFTTVKDGIRAEDALNDARERGGIKREDLRPSVQRVLFLRAGLSD
jgi:beta-N-acetylhexosaminidase